MNTSTDRVIRTMTRHLTVTLGASINGSSFTIKVGDAARRASADPEFRDALTQVIEAPGPPSGSVNACADPRIYNDAGQERPQISENENRQLVNFWTSLTGDQKRVFRAKAHERVFAAGARLMREGEPGDHVAVIVSGLTEIRVREGDAERVVATRGPGQLIGERAALEVNPRSATVVALQTVVARVMRTADFAAFVSTYPSVLKIVEEQIFTRMREHRARPERADVGIDMINRLPDSTGCSAEQVHVLQAKVSEAAGSDLRVRGHLAELLAAAINLERSSFGTEEAHRLRSQPSPGDIAAVRDAWTRLTSADGAPPTPPADEDLREDETRGYLGPDPLRIRTAAEFAGALRLFRTWAGQPSYRQIARTGRPPMAASTIAAALSGRQLPTLHAVTALVTGCGGSKEDLEAFTTAWRHVRLAGGLSDQRSEEPVDLDGLNASDWGQHPAGQDHIAQMFNRR